MLWKFTADSADAPVYQFSPPPIYSAGAHAEFVSIILSLQCIPDCEINNHTWHLAAVILLPRGVAAGRDGSIAARRSKRGRCRARRAALHASPKEAAVAPWLCVWARAVTGDGITPDGTTSSAHPLASEPHR